MEIKGKKYSYIFWDWLWTLYDGDTYSLYDWVVPLFEKTADTKHFLITWTSNMEKRMKQIEQSPIRKYFEKVAIIEVDKLNTFKELMEKYDIPPSEVIVIGDNYLNEITAAKNLGLDWIHISDFVKGVSSKQGER